MKAEIDGNFVEINWVDGGDKKTLLITPENIVKNYNALPAFERLTEDVILVDGKHYQQMSDEQAASLIWGSGITQNIHKLGTEWNCKCGTTNMLDVPICQACFLPRL